MESQAAGAAPRAAWPVIGCGPAMTRKTFLQTAIGAPVLGRAASASDTIGLGMIGTGTRGGDLIKDVLKTTGSKIVAICDVYKPHVDKGIQMCGNAEAKRYVDYRDLLADKNVDAVVVATPDHWHAQMLIDACDAGKDVYMEKGWTRTVDEAKAMLAKVKQSGRVMQLGHQGRQYAAARQARALIERGDLGPVTLVTTGRCGNTLPERATWRWYGYYSAWDRPEEAFVVKNLDWARWLGPAPKQDFSMERFWHWRCYWDYGTGVAGDLLSHELDYVQSVLRYGIPDRCATLGGIHYLDDGREVPDTTSTTYEFDKQKCTVTFVSTMNSAMPLAPEFRGKFATLRFNRIGQDANDFEVLGDRNAGKHPAGVIRKFDPAATPAPPSHMQDFLNCIRDRGKPQCDEDEAFIEAVTFIMSAVAYREQRVVRWDREKQQIV
jgi:predicted dehydrogenase